MAALLVEMAAIGGRHHVRESMWADPVAKARSLGFDSVDEMTALTGRGYPSKAAYLEVKVRSAGQFARECRSANSKEHRARCQGQRVSWTGLLEQHDGSTAKVAVLNDDGSPLGRPFSIDSTSLAKVIAPEKVGRLVTFDGAVGRQNGVTPRIEQVTFAAIESDAAVAVRQARLGGVEAVRVSHGSLSPPP